MLHYQTRADLTLSRDCQSASLTGSGDEEAIPQVKLLAFKVSSAAFTGYPIGINEGSNPIEFIEISYEIELRSVLRSRRDHNRVEISTCNFMPTQIV